jgi:NAD(P)H-hydrate epimerase
MKLFTASQIQAWDAHTIKEQGITSFALMERASFRLFEAIAANHLKENDVVHIVCGPGNNAGDGIQLATFLLLHTSVTIHIYIHADGFKPESDAQQSWLVLNKHNSARLFCHHHDEFFSAALATKDILIDAVFGTGYRLESDAYYVQLVATMNEKNGVKIAIDIPSCLPTDFQLHPIAHPVFKAQYTYTFQVPKLSFLLPETGSYVGQFTILDIGLSNQFRETEPSNTLLITEQMVKAMLKPSTKFAHKGTHGHLLTIGGSFGKMGAAILMAKSALHTGAGLVTAYIPKTGYQVLQTALPECMVLVDENLYEISKMPQANAHDAYAVGPGMGTSAETQHALMNWLTTIKNPVVLDADALNILARQKDEMGNINFPENCIITPHPKEFDRLAGRSVNSAERIEKLKHFAQQYKVVVVLKGAHTAIATPGGQLYFNTTGTPAMATAGSGDVLTGVIGALLVRKYDSVSAALVAVHIHGLAGEIAVKNSYTLLASDIANCVGVALKKLFDNE